MYTPGESFSDAISKYDAFFTAMEDKSNSMDNIRRVRIGLLLHPRAVF
jgi:hypothetical protein